MLTGHTVGLLEYSESNQLLLKDPVSETDDEEGELSRKVLHVASFEELARPHLQYDTVIWVLISLLLVLAWGVGVIMLLYLPIRRYVLNKDISSRKLYVTQDEIVYKVVRPSFLPFLGFTKTEKRIPLHMVIDIIIEQGCLQSIYGIHTFRVENIAYGKAAAMDELQVQGVSDPDLLRKVIISEAAKSIQVKCWNAGRFPGDGESPLTHTGYLMGVSPISRFRSPSGKMAASPRFEPGAVAPGDFLRKLEEVKQSVKRLESLVGGSEEDIEEC
ncbi:unnamed protein product [Spirodela intermedia]|uniref:DUF7642 domain-containing protein n=1 Tax=Spirodela intermedia TaxID=51605 RepID=A0A7I8K480_SPIIN|nr:unnamed protein product [Spirodela intermedia]